MQTLYYCDVTMMTRKENSDRTEFKSKTGAQSRGSGDRGCEKDEDDLAGGGEAGMQVALVHPVVQVSYPN